MYQQANLLGTSALSLMASLAEFIERYLRQKIARLELNRQIEEHVAQRILQKLEKFEHDMRKAHTQHPLSTLHQEQLTPNPQPHTPPQRETEQLERLANLVADSRTDKLKDPHWQETTFKPGLAEFWSMVDKDKNKPELSEQRNQFYQTMNTHFGSVMEKYSRAVAQSAVTPDQATQKASSDIATTLISQANNSAHQTQQEKSAELPRYHAHEVPHGLATRQQLKEAQLQPHAKQQPAGLLTTAKGRPAHLYTIAAAVPTKTKTRDLAVQLSHKGISKKDVSPSIKSASQKNAEPTTRRKRSRKTSSTPVHTR